MRKSALISIPQLVARHSSLVTLVLLVAGCRVGGSASTPAEVSRSPNIHFTDVTAAVGIHFRHSNGAEGRLLVPQRRGTAFRDRGTERQGERATGRWEAPDSPCRPVVPSPARSITAWRLADQRGMAGLQSRRPARSVCLSLCPVDAG